MTNPERAFNFLAGSTVLSWAAAIAQTQLLDPAPSWSPWVVVTLHVVVGLLFFVRCPVLRSGSCASAIAAAPSVLVAGFAVAPSAGAAPWPPFAEAVFVLGGAIAVAALLSLGRSFAVMPALRVVVDTGLYRFVRHPVYLGEGLMVIGCVLADPGVEMVTVCVAAAVLLSIRVRVEEHGLSRDAAYVDYCRRVRWRWLPGLR